MKSNHPFLLVFLLSFYWLSSQNKGFNFPQNEIDKINREVLNHYPLNESNNSVSLKLKPNITSASPIRLESELRKVENLKYITPSIPAWLQIGDTIVVGATPNDTLRINGYWTHKGPILVLGTGVLIFHNATVIDTGDIYVFQNGKLFADSSSLTFPQNYFYERSLLVVQNGFAQFDHCNFNYSGMSHNLVMGDSAKVYMSNIHQNDWTTAGLFSNPTFSLSNCNISGEFILMDSCQVNFHKADTIILWHHIPIGGNINYTFPSGSTVNTHDFYNGAPGVNGINYIVHADTCQNVMWALMPENGSSVTINNSNIRLIGNWFRYGDTVSVSNLYDSTFYNSYTAPLSDRVLQLNNSYVNTWSLYVFDSSHIDLNNAQVGEVGTQKFASVTQLNPFLLDGTGGYYWCTDTSSVLSYGATIYTTARSEKSGLFIMAYDWVPFTAPSAIGSSLMVCVQSQTAADPIAYDAGTVWMAKIDGPDTSFTNNVVPVIGSAWIDWAAAGTGWMDFLSYSVYYTPQSVLNWTKVVQDSSIELHHANLANWNTNLLNSGAYFLRLTVKNIYGDSVDAIYPVYLKQGTVGIYENTQLVNNNLNIYPNPTNNMLHVSSDRGIQSIRVYDLLGKMMFEEKVYGPDCIIKLSDWNKGIYILKALTNEGNVVTKRFSIY